MSSEFKKKTYLGLDVGTSTVGFAVTDDDYKVVEKRGKQVWGVHSFNEASSAVERRLYRTARRRLDRRKQRVRLLQELFNDKIMAVDCNFLPRLNENDLILGDRSIVGKYSLFNDKGFTDIDYYNKYPTIYHLRQELRDKPCKDIRLLYLAVHHIIKYRGHFLIEDKIDNSIDVLPTFNLLNLSLTERQESFGEDNNFSDNIINEILPLDLSQSEKINEIIISKLSVREKKKSVYDLFGASKEQKVLLDIMLGSKVNIYTLFGKGAYEKDLFTPFEFSSESFDATDAELKSNLSQEDYQIICALKKLYDWQVLTKILKGNNSISDAMVDIYEEHKKDLNNLKYLITKYDIDNYDKMFGLPLDKSQKAIDKNNNNYTKYVGGGNIKEGNGRLGQTCSQDEFYRTVKVACEKIKPFINTETDNGSKDFEMIEDILKRIEEYSYMPKQASRNNTAIPYQLNMLELEEILQTAKATFGDFVDKNADKIKLLLSHRVPYYVGPTNTYHQDTNDNIWVVRKKEGSVTPWNFDDMINLQESNEAFITRMTTFCTYIKSAKSLPRHSILFSKFVALNELNTIKVNDTPLTVSEKQGIFNEIYLKNKKPTAKAIRNYLISLNIGYDKNLILSGFNGDIKGNMSTYLSLKKVIGDKVDNFPQEMENLVFYLTIHQDTKIIEETLNEKFSNILTPEEIKILKGYRYNGWGSLSKELLQGSLYGGLVLMDEKNNPRNIIDIMYDENLCLQEIMNDKRFNFKSAIKEFEPEQIADINYDTDIKDLYCSPAVKKSLWQSFLLTKELVEETGIPKKIFIESTREHSDKLKNKESISRKNQILNLYKEAHRLSKDLQEKKVLENCGKALENMEDTKLNAEKIYLYFLQLGKCAYSNSNISLDELSNYDIDHIIPQSKKKDDSFNNKVLVLSNINREKGKEYPVPLHIQGKCKSLWSCLRKLNLMSEDKYARLVRSTPLTQQEQEGFVQRQLVETSQTVVLLRDILIKWLTFYTQKHKCKMPEIVLFKSGNVSDFRKDYNLTKSREVNDFHHACDAYLNVVVGNVLTEHFNHNKNDDAKNQQGESKTDNFRKTFHQKVYSYREKRHIWYPANNDNEGTLAIIKEQLKFPKFLVTKKVEEKSGELFKETIFKSKKNDFLKESGDLLYPRCETYPKSDYQKYGGNKSSGTAYLFVVDYQKKEKIKRRIECMPIYYNKKIKNGTLTLQQYVKDNLNFEKAHIPQIDGLNAGIIKVGTLFEINGTKLRISGATGNQIIFHNANQLFVDEEQNKYIKELSIISNKVLKFTSKVKKNERDEANLQKCQELIAENERRKNSEYCKNSDAITVLTSERNLDLYDFMVSKLSSKPYEQVPNYLNLSKTLTLKRENFISLDIFQQIILLLNVLKAFQCNAPSVDASLLGEGANLGKILLGKEFKEGTEIYMITQSISGLREKRIKLSK